MRLFVAINLPATVREAIYDDVAPVRASASGLRWVGAGALHVTVKFLGEQQDRLVPEIDAALRKVGERHAPVSIRTTELGAFPNFRRPRVVWVGMSPASALGALAEDVDGVLAPLGIARETRAFQSHLTLGRVKDQLSARDAATLAEAAEACHPSRDFAVQTVDLMRSELGPGGSRYSVLAAVPLHARGT
jgi:2'-5' RNA ligase